MKVSVLLLSAVLLAVTTAKPQSRTQTSGVPRRLQTSLNDPRRIQASLNNPRRIQTSFNDPRRAQALANASGRKSDITSGLETCLTPTSTKDTYNKCLLEETKKIQPMFAAGIPELDIPPMDPLLLENINFQRTEGSVTLDAIFSNVRVTGLKHMDIKYIDVDLFSKDRAQRKVGLGLTIPTMLLRGQYVIDGNVFLLPIEGNGNFISKLDTVIVEGSGDIVQVPGQLKTKAENINVGFKIRKMATKMDNLFEGNKVLSDTLHHFLNQNSQLILEEIRPELTKTLNTLVHRLFAAVFTAAPEGLHAHTIDPEGVQSGRIPSLGGPQAAVRAPQPSQQG